MSNQMQMFETDDLPLFSQTAPRGKVEVFTPTATPRQLHFGGCPICANTGLVVARKGAKTTYCTCRAGERARKERNSQ